MAEDDTGSRRLWCFSATVSAACLILAASIFLLPHQLRVTRRVTLGVGWLAFLISAGSTLVLCINSWMQTMQRGSVSVIRQHLPQLLLLLASTATLWFTLLDESGLLGGTEMAKPGDMLGGEPWPAGGQRAETAAMATSCSGTEAPIGGRTADDSHAISVESNAALSDVILICEKIGGVSIKCLPDDVTGKHVAIPIGEGSWETVLIRLLKEHDLTLWHNVGTETYEVRRKE